MPHVNELIFESYDDALQNFGKPKTWLNALYKIRYFKKLMENTLYKRRYQLAEKLGVDIEDLPALIEKLQDERDRRLLNYYYGYAPPIDYPPILIRKGTPTRFVPSAADLTKEFECSRTTINFIKKRAESRLAELVKFE